MNYKLTQRLLTVKDLNLSYGPKQILRDINLHVDDIVRPDVTQGQVIALLGPSGSGKTQLFRCLAGLQKPTTGEISLMDNKPVGSGEVGVVQQAYPLMQHRTILGNLLLAAKPKYNGTNTPSDVKKEALALLERFGLSDKADKYPVQLSGGQRQRVAIIQQMLSSNHFLLMDEPFSGLDIIAKEKVCALIQEVSTTNELNTIIFTTHDLASAVQIADTVWVLGKGLPDEKGEVKPGTTVRATIDLIELGLAWNPNVDKHPNYWPTIQKLKELFKTL